MAPRTRDVVRLEIASFHNSKGFAGLPTELLHQIVSHWRQAVIPWIYADEMLHRYSERREHLRTLCQLCRSLRAIFLPLLWERLEACTNPHNNLKTKPCALSLETDLLGQLKLVMDRKLRYTPYVRVASVTVDRSKPTDTILKKLARALSLMPNVHTVQIICLSPGTETMPPSIEARQFREAFEGYTYPSVRHVVVPDQPRSIFACFPQAQHVHIAQQWVRDSSDLIAGVAKYCHAVEDFGLVEDSNIGLIVTMLPRLRRLEYYITECERVEVMELSKLQNLEQIKLTFDAYLEVHDKATLVIEAARSVLAKSQAPQRNKRLVVAYKFYDGSEPQVAQVFNFN